MKILPECDENNLKKERKTDLLNLVDILFKDFDILKNDKENMKQYYNSVQNLLDFKDIKETIKNDIDNSIYSIDENKNRLNEKENYSKLTDSAKLKNIPKGGINLVNNKYEKSQISGVNDIEKNNGKTNNISYKNNINSNIIQNQISNNEGYSDNKIGDSIKFQNSNFFQNQSNLPNTNNNANETNYSSDKMGPFIPKILIKDEGKKQPTTDTNYSSDKKGPFNNIQPNLIEEQSKQNIFPNQSSTSLNQEKSPDIPFSSKIEGEGKKRETVNHNDNNKINDLVVS